MASVNHCFLCNTLLKGNVKILKCLHLICNSCAEQKETFMRNSGVRCKCNTITEGELANFSFVSPDLSSTKQCIHNDCNNLATIICVLCNTFYCKPCSKIHLSINSSNHSQSIMLSYPIKEPFSLCPKCKIKSVEVCCTKCGVIICSLCHLTYHHCHAHKILGNFFKEIISDISNKKVELEKNNNFIIQHLELLATNAIILKNQKIAALKEIDDKFELLKYELDKRKEELKNDVEECFEANNFKIDKNKNVHKEIMENNSYLINLAGLIINHDNITDIVELSKIVANKINNSSRYILNIDKLIGKVPINIQCLDDESLKICISAINAVGNICPPEILSLTEIVNSPQSLIYHSRYSVYGCVLDNNQTLLLSNIGALHEMLPTPCACCNQWGAKLSQCNFCKRYYHSSCHIPMLDTPFYGKFKTQLKCTMCIDIVKETAGMQISIIKDISVEKIEWKLIERLLMELYCKNSDSEYFRILPNRLVYPQYYIRTSKPISLDLIKKRHESALPYESIIDFIMDVKRLFSNAKLCYNNTDPFYQSAIVLEDLFNSKLNSWIPELKHFL